MPFSGKISYGFRNPLFFPENKNKFTVTFKTVRPSQHQKHLNEER